MKTERHRFRPQSLDPLERRLAPSRGGPIIPALIGTLSPNPKASGRSGRVAAQIGDTFDRFQADYLQAQGAYLSSGAPQVTLTTFTAQRVNLLSQELVRIFARLPGSFSKIENSGQRASAGNAATVFQAVLYRNVSGAANTSLVQILNSNAVVPPPGTSGAAATLYTLTATNAIQAARTSLINAARFIANKTFDKH